MFGVKNDRINSICTNWTFQNQFVILEWVLVLQELLRKTSYAKMNRAFENKCCRMKPGTMLKERNTLVGEEVIRHWPDSKYDLLWLHRRDASVRWVSFDPLWPYDAIWRQRSGKTLALLMACCLATPSHHPNQCGPMIKRIPWYLSGDIITKKIWRYKSVKLDWKLFFFSNNCRSFRNLWLETRDRWQYEQLHHGRHFIKTWQRP